MLILAILTIAILSLGLSLLSLKNLRKMGEIQSAKEDLKKHKVVYQRDSSISPSEKSGSSSS